MRILVLGAYGFIGRSIARALHAAGHAVTGLGRDEATGKRVLPGIGWVRGDLARLREPRDWDRLLEGMQAVVNSAGALQDGPRDDLEGVHHAAVASLASACAARGIRLVHVSAPGASSESGTEFMRSKARGEAAIARAGGDWVILRPGLVLGAQAWGGSALLRSLAAFPLVQPLALGDRRVQCVSMDDVARVAVESAEGRFPAGSAFDLVEDHPRALADVVAKLRAWLGVPPPVVTLGLPRALLSPVATVADALAHLGWRTPLRTTAIRALDAEVVGDPAPLAAARGRPLASLDELLAERPAGAAERIAARMALALPPLLAVLSLFWIASGAIALADIPRAARTIPESVLDPATARALVVAGAAVDLALGLAVLVRPAARAACLGMVTVSAAYLAAGTVLTPGLWLDPLGPFMKVLPAAAAALVAAALVEGR